MDEKRVERIENHLVELLRTSIPRREFEEKLRHIDSRVGRALDGLSKLQSHLQRYEELEERVDEVEKITIPAKHRHTSRVYFWPTIATIAGVLVNATLAAITLIVH